MSKSYKISSRSIKIAIDDLKLQKMIHGLITTPNHYNQDTAPQAIEIKRLIEGINIQLILDRI